MFDAEPIPQKKPVVVPRDHRILYFTADWCPACKPITAKFDWLRKSKWTIGDSPDNHIQVVDIDEHPEIWSKYLTGSPVLPTAIGIYKDRMIVTLQPVHAIDLANLYLNYPP